MPTINSSHPPDDASSLAAWFAAGVRAELLALEKEQKGSSQNHELLAGRLLEKRSSTQAIFQFTIADGTRIPEEAEGRLKTENNEYAVTVIGQQADRIDLCMECKAPPPGIHRAILIIDDTALLRKLAQVLDETAQEPTLVSQLAVTAFHPSKAKTGFAALRPTSVLANFEGQPRRIAEQACGSTLTYIWGPPGTGKTYTIAHLVTALIEAGERVLVSSHTHAAVDQALYEAVKPRSEKNKEGPLAEHPIVIEGRVLRIGVAKAGLAPGEKIPSTVRLEAVVEAKGRELADAVLALTRRAKPLVDERSKWLAIFKEWDRLTSLTKRLTETHSVLEQLEAERKPAESAIASCRSSLEQRRADFEKAQSAWLWRMTKTAKALEVLHQAERQIESAETLLVSVQHEITQAQRQINELELARSHQQAASSKYPAMEKAEQELSQIALELKPIEQELQALQDEIAKLEQKVIAEARGVFCTLTGLYAGNAGRALEGQSFDAVIVDEISMALPPLIFLAAGRAKSRVILVGDFLQLPPIVRGDTPLGDARLATDVFHLAGVAKDLKPDMNCKVFTKLDTQHRMRSEIADVARHLVYTAAGGLHDYPKKWEPLEWLEFLPENPLVIVDTSDLHCWSGKQPGSLSRFNFDSAMVAVEIAALAAAKLQKPLSDNAPPIGIVTPFTAQRRLLTKLLADLELKDWVAAGTVHTFQGAEADLIIFDSVLDEPYWSARLCNPRDAMYVKRDLNVAVTRAKNKFVFVGSSDWLNKHAKRTSALGQMWHFLKDRAVLISAIDLVNLERFQRVFEQHGHETGWNVPSGHAGYAFEHLDETSFFERFTRDLNAASDSIFGLAPFFGEYRWPRIQPVIAAALKRRVKVTLVTPPLAEIENESYVKSVIQNLRDLGAIVVTASGIHGKDVIIDEQILYTGSMNWSSNRGRLEEVHRLHVPGYAKLCLEQMQAKHVRQAAIHEDGSPRVCPNVTCGWPLQIVNQRQQHGAWDFQPMKVGCTNPNCKGYLRNIDERASFKTAPFCRVDGRTKHRRVRRGRGEIWQCPKHPKQCPSEKVVPGDPR